MANTAAKKITYDGKPVQVESAVRDGTGKIINQTYQEKPKVIEYSVDEYIEGYPVIAKYSGTYDETPGYVRFTIEIRNTTGHHMYDFLTSWQNSSDPGYSITMLSSTGDSGLELVGITCLSTGPKIFVGPADTYDTTVRIVVLESTTDLEWATDWSETITDTGGGKVLDINYQHYAEIEYADYSRTASSANTATKADNDGQNTKIDTAYVRHAEYTVAVSTSQQYHKAFSDLALGTNSAGQARKPRQVEIYDPSGNQIQTDVTIDLTNSRITIYPTAVDPAQTWTVRVTAW